MRRLFGFTLLLATAVPAWSASKPHVVFLGKAQQVKIFANREESQSENINVRPLYVDGKLKEYTTSEAHDVTDHQFVVQRAFRVNDALPGDTPKQSKWVWQRGDWLLVDRVSGHITQIKLPDFNALYSRVDWYRDYAAYCGASDDGERWYAEIAQIGVRKAIYRKEVDRASHSGEAAGCEFGPPKWEKRPPRVTFSPSNGQPFTVNVIARHAQELAGDNEAEQ